MDQPFNDQNQYTSGQNGIYATQGQPPLNENPPSKPNYYPPPQNIPQNYAPPQVTNPPAQPVASVGTPLQYNNSPTAPFQQGIPVNNYPQMGGVPQPIPQYNNRYQQYTNINQISHKGITQVDENTFYITTGCCFKLFPYIFTLFGGVFISIWVFAGSIIPGLCGIFFAFLGICMFFTLYNNIYFVMGPNSLTVMKKAACRKKTKIYNAGELQRVEFNYNYSSTSIDSNATHNYKLVVIPTNGKEDTLFEVGSSSRVFTNEEIEYFLYYINNHIQTKMRV